MRLQHAYGFWRPLLTILGMGPGFSYIEVANGNLTVVFGWSFRMKAPLSAIASQQLQGSPVPLAFGVGVHGWAGEWAVNGARRPHVVVEFDEKQRGYVIGFPVRIRKLHICPADAAKFAEALQRV